MAEFSGSGLAISSSLLQHDPELFDLIEREKYRQWSGLELIASENFTNGAVLECLGSCLTNKYAEGLPSARYYGGNENIDKIEELCRRRALEAFNLNPEEWGVNVQPYSGSPANFAVYTALLRPHDRIMGLDLPSGGHLTHGYYTFAKGARKPISATSIFFESLPYQVNPQTGLLDLSALRQQAMLFRPSLIITGGSAYPREWPYAEIKSIADDCGALLMCDMAHIAGLIAGSEAESPFEVCDVVTTTTHKTLGGPRAGIIFFKKYKMVNGTKVIVDFESRINSAVFPGLQGGPHENTIAAIATQLKLVSSVEFRRYAGQVRRNISRLSLVLMSFGYKLATDGTDNHLLLWDLRPLSGDGSIHGAKFEKYLDRVHITVNKNTICGQTNAVNPAAIRIGSPALTTRGMGEEDFALIGQLLHRSVQNLIQLHGHAKCCNKSKDVGKDVNTVTTKAFVEFLDIRREELDELNHSNEVKIAFSVMDEIRHQVAEFAMRFPMPGFDVSQMRYRSEEDVANAIHVTNT